VTVISLAGSFRAIMFVTTTRPSSNAIFRHHQTEHDGNQQEQVRRFPNKYFADVYWRLTQSKFRRECHRPREVQETEKTAKQFALPHSTAYSPTDATGLSHL
jgi:hypothetical protein